MCIGVRNNGGWVVWSKYNGSFWIEYVPRVERLVIDIDGGGSGRSSFQDYTPVLTSVLHRWQDE